MKSINILLALIAAIFLNSCSTDFETIAPYKETTVVYGLMNQNDSAQQLRISKAFLGEGNALVMAKETDSVYYGDNLEVKLERIIHFGVEATDVLTRVIDSSKEAGDFVSPVQVLYVSSPNFVKNNNEDYEYRLTVTNKLTGAVATSSTHSIKNVALFNDGSLYQWKPNTTTTVDFSDDMYFEILQSSLAKVYNITIDVHYEEHEKAFPTSPWEPKTFTWKLGDKINTGGDKLRFDVFKDEFYKAVAAFIPVDVTKARRFAAPGVKTMEVHLFAGTEELYAYMQVTQPSYGVVADRPIYTNISNGLGVFTSRNEQVFPASVNQSTIDSLKANPLTSGLGF